MNDSTYLSSDASSQVTSDEIALVEESDRTTHIDRCFRVMANRRRRFYLYHLLREDAPIELRRLAELVETSLAPRETVITDRIVEDALANLVHSHLPKLREAELVRVNDQTIELVSDPALPIRDWLSMTVEVELEP